MTMTIEVEKATAESRSFSLAPGESKPHVLVKVSGRVLYACRLSLSFYFFTIQVDNDDEGSTISSAAPSKTVGTAKTDITSTTDADDNSANDNNVRLPPILDIILKKADGWDLDKRSTVMDHLEALLSSPSSGMTVNHKCSIVGYPERMRAKFVCDEAPICLHAMSIIVSQDNCNNDGIADDKLQQSSATYELPTASWGQSKIQRNFQQQAQETQENAAGNNNINGEAEEDSQRQQPQSRNSNSKRGAKDNSRFSRFSLFLLEEFGGYEGLCQKPVLDIAGGAGALAFELSVRSINPSISVFTMCSFTSTVCLGFCFPLTSFIRHATTLLLL